MLFRARLAKRLLQPREEPVVAAHALNFHFAKTMYDVTILQYRHGVEHHLGSRAFFALYLDPCTPRAQRGSGNQCFALQMDDEKVGERDRRDACRSAHFDLATGAV